MQQLSPDEVNDTTKPSASSVKVSQTLDSDGLNPCLYNRSFVGSPRSALRLFKKPMPRTKANSAALHLLISSTPKEFAYHLASKCAYDALLWITSKIQGGHDRSFNSEWFQSLIEGEMTWDETLEQYVLRISTRYQNLLTG